ncbi:MAG: nuclear transport factor 2 family protein, partial [Terriglobia bacterium]
MSRIFSARDEAVKKLEGKRSETTVRQILLIPLLMTALAGFARAQETAGNPTDAEVEKQILKVEHEKDQAMQKGDVATLDRIYGDDLSFVNVRGQVLNKAQRLADYRPGVTKYSSFKQGDYHFHVYGDTVVMIGRSDGVVEYHGRMIRAPR